MRRLGGGEQRKRDEALEMQLEALDLRVAELENAQRDGNAALSAAPLRMMLVEGSYQIVAVFAQDLETLLRSPQLLGENLPNVLRRLLPETRYAAAREYLSMLFDARHSEAEIAAANPLEAVEVMVPSADGPSVPRTLSFGFRRVPGDERVLVWVDDVTERLARAQALRVADATKAKQLDVLLEIAHIQREALDDFTDFVQEELKAIDAALRAGESPLVSQREGLRERVNEILRRISAIERRARELRFEYFERCAGSYARKVAELASRETLGGDDFLGLVMEQSAFRAELDDLRMLRRRLEAPPPRSEPNLVVEIGELAARLATAARKDVIVDADGFDALSLSPEQRALLRVVLEELIRNAIVHGIESPEERAAAGKQRTGRLEIRRSAGAPSQTFAFRFRDDGRGLDVVRIGERAVKRGLFESERAESLDETQTAALVFAPEMGRGLSELKRRVVDEFGGSISVDSQSGTFCEFLFVIPERR